MRSWKSIKISFNGNRLVSMTRRTSSVSVWSTAPRRSEINAIMSPMFSFGQITKALTIGSSIFWI